MNDSLRFVDEELALFTVCHIIRHNYTRDINYQYRKNFLPARVHLREVSMYYRFFFKTPKRGKYSSARLRTA